MRVKQIDEYITLTQDLLRANPSATTISITYTHSKKKSDDDSINKSIIKFKTYDARHGICYNFRTHKIKEFSKLANALGPRGCNVQGVDINGLSLILSNVEKSDVVKENEPVIENTKEVTPLPESNPQKKKGKKKKGKK